jgi:hypothetical protein
MPSAKPKQTFEPSKLPILKPSNPPTKLPIVVPKATRRPTVVPSATPIVEQKNPTKPVANATATFKPTAKVNRTIAPSTAPSLVPKAKPVARSVNPTKTIEPTIIQYEYNKTSLNTPDVVMQFTLGNRRLQDADNSNSTSFNISSACEVKWKTYVEERIEEEVDNSGPEYEELNVNVDNITASKRSGLLLLSYNVLIDMRSELGSDQDTSQYIEGPFDTNEEKDELITYLKTTNCSEFADVQWVTVTVPDQDSSGVEENTGNNTKNSQSQLGLIIGLSAAIGAVIMITIAFLIIKTRKRRHLLEDDGEEYRPGFDTTASGSRGNGDGRKDFNYVSEIGIDANQDVSTLGDPFPPGYARSLGGGIGGGAGDDNDLSTIESNDVDYDYRKAYLESAQSTSMLSEATGAVHPQDAGGATSTTEDNDIHTIQDDGKIKQSNKSRGGTSTGQSINTFPRYNSVQEPYEVLAPPGLLGLVIESDNDGGFPIVHSIKKDSVLFGVVKEGDCVLSIDGQDVSSMNAGAASMLIASKKNQDVRTFVFSRIMTP